MSSSSELDRSPFSLEVASCPLRWVETSSVIDLLELTHAEERIELYRKEMEEGALFPPIAVVSLRQRLILADGHKRLAAVRRLGVDRIPVEVWGAHRFFLDQSRQLRKNAAKNRRILGQLFSNPKRAWDLLATTLAHWRRVARNISQRARGHISSGPHRRRD